MAMLADGRAFARLSPRLELTVVDEARLLYLDPAAITPDPDNVRRDGSGDIETLADSIRVHGLLQPIGVARESGDYRVVYGNRRREAAIRAGLNTIPCLPWSPARRRTASSASCSRTCSART